MTLDFSVLHRIIIISHSKVETKQILSHCVCIITLERRKFLVFIEILTSPFISSTTFVTSDTIENGLTDAIICRSFSHDLGRVIPQRGARHFVHSNEYQLWAATGGTAVYLRTSRSTKTCRINKRSAKVAINSTGTLRPWRHVLQCCYTDIG